MVIIIMFFFVSFFSSCNTNFGGFFVSTDLDLRLEAKDDFIFLKNNDLNTNFGSEYSFMVIADTHITYRNANGFEKINNIVSSDPDIKFIVITGDITQRGRREEIERFIEIADFLNIPVYPVIGNHDINFNNWVNWRDLIGSSSYRVNGGNTSLFILDSANSFFGKEQLDWLEDELNSTLSERIFIFTHTNIFVERPVGIPLITSARERARLISILGNRADYMFSGHSHENLLREAGGVMFLTVENFNSNNVYCIVRVSNEGISYSLERL